MKYEETVKKICGEGWRDADLDERDGGYGVACVMAFLDNSRPGLDDISKHLGVPNVEIECAYRRLQASRVFSMGNGGYNARRDRALLGYSTPSEGRMAWCSVAGIASGYIGQGYYVQRSVTPKSEQKQPTAEKQKDISNVAVNH